MINFNNYININTVGILGLGVSGRSVINFYKKNNIKIYIWDDDEKTRNDFKISKTILSNFNEVKNLNKVELLFVSPGINLKHPIISLAKKNNISIVGDLDIFWKNLHKDSDKVIAVTGSNGKSTVCSIINHLLKSSNQNSSLGGNIGIPVLNLKPASDSITYVLEVSSYQLELMKKIKPNIAILTNLSPDHIERHGTYKGYVKAKEKIFMNQDSSDLAIINTDSKEGEKMYKTLKSKINGPKIIRVSIKNKFQNSVYVESNKIINSLGVKNKLLGTVKELTSLLGQHNIENVLISLSAVLSYGLSHKEINTYLPKFKTLPHRIEDMGTKKNIKFINDSKSTNLISSSVALDCFKNIIWIAGGRRKNDSFKLLNEKITNIKAGFFIGESGEEFFNYFKNNFYCKNCLNLESAINAAINYAKILDLNVIILFSPGCSSFDQYNNFETRGNAFKNKVNIFIRNN